VLPCNRIPLCGPSVPVRSERRGDAGPLARPMSEKSDALAVPVDVTMRLPTLWCSCTADLAVPLAVRSIQVEEAGALAALVGRAFEAERWDAAELNRFLCNLLQRSVTFAHGSFP
jgi:hypothetical protein